MRFLKPTRLRLYSQIFFFALFLLLLLRTEFRGSLSSSASEIRLPYPVGMFFRLDPLVAIGNALSSHALYKGLLLSLFILIPTLFFGRFFCGWICPLGSIHHFFGSLKSERKRGKQLIESNRYKRWQNTKYYLLAAVLVAAALGSGIVGWFDPFSFLVRSLGLSILPSTNYGLQAFVRVLEQSPSGLLRAVGGSAQYARDRAVAGAQICPVTREAEAGEHRSALGHDSAGVRKIGIGEREACELETRRSL